MAANQGIDAGLELRVFLLRARRSVAELVIQLVDFLLLLRHSELVGSVLACQRCGGGFSVLSGNQSFLNVDDRDSWLGNRRRQRDEKWAQSGEDSHTASYNGDAVLKMC